MEGREFLGQGVKFPLQIDPRTGKIAMSGEEENIREAIGIILRTSQGERIMRANFGSNVMEYLFQPLRDGMEQVEAELRDQITYQEPRVTDVEVSCSAAQDGDGWGSVGSAMQVSVSYTIRSINSRFNHVYPFYMTEGSEGGGGA